MHTMSFNLILFKLMLLLGLSCSLAATIGKDNEETEAKTSDLQTSATSAKLVNLGSLLGLGNSGYYPNSNNNNYRPGCTPCYGNNAFGCYCPGTSKYPTANYPNSNYYPNNNFYPNSNYYPNNNYYPNSNYYPNNNNNYPNSFYPSGTNILGGGYGGYGGYGGNGGLRQYYGYNEPNYAGQRNLGYAYYTNTNNYGLPSTTNNRYVYRERDRASSNFRGYE